eukprot:361620-Chlamydomonas_euryale.AAC.4
MLRHVLHAGTANGVEAERVVGRTAPRLLSALSCNSNAQARTTCGSGRQGVLAEGGEKAAPQAVTGAGAHRHRHRYRYRCGATKA